MIEPSDLGTLAQAWLDRPKGAEFLGNPAFHRLFLTPRRLKPKLIVKGSGIDWLAVSAEWEAQGMKLSKADLERLASATGRFVKLPNSGWVELDTAAVQSAHEAMADLGVAGLIAVPQKVGMENVAHLGEAELSRFADTAEAKALRARVADFKGVRYVAISGGVKAEMRPYQRDGFDFLCHLGPPLRRAGGTPARPLQSKRDTMSGRPPRSPQPPQPTPFAERGPAERPVPALERRPGSGSGAPAVRA